MGFWMSFLKPEPEKQSIMKLPIAILAAISGLGLCLAPLGSGTV